MTNDSFGLLCDRVAQQIQMRGPANANVADDVASLRAAGLAGNIVSVLKRPVMVTVAATIQNAGAPSSTKTYIAGSGEVLVVREVQGFIASDAPSAEVQVDPQRGWTQTLEQVERAKSQAARMRLERQNGAKITEGEDLALAAILPSVGGRALQFGPTDFVLAGGSAIDLTINVVDPATINTRTRYGVVLVGYYLKPVFA